MKSIFISWVAFSSRSDLVASTFNAKSFFINKFINKTFFHTFLRYAYASLFTSFILMREKPKIVFVMNIPVFLPILIYIYSIVFKCKFIIDSHSGLFNKKQWSIFIPAMKIVYKHSLLNIAHNRHDQSIYESWNIKTRLLSTELYMKEDYDKITLQTSKNIVVIGLYAPDEPIHEILQVAHKLPDVHFYVTGPIKNAKKIDLTLLPGNVTLTDFLPRKDFMSLVQAADVAMVLVKHDNTMQNGAWQALSLGTPLILSNWQILREVFPKGAVFVNNTVEDIKAGVERFYANSEKLTKDIQELLHKKVESWNHEVRVIWEEIENAKRDFCTASR